MHPKHMFIPSHISNCTGINSSNILYRKVKCTCTGTAISYTAFFALIKEVSIHPLYSGACLVAKKKGKKFNATKTWMHPK